MKKMNFYGCCLALLMFVVALYQPQAAFASDKVKGKALQAGDCIGIIAPAGYIKSGDISRVIDCLTKAGYRVKLGRTVDKRYGYFAGTDIERAGDVNSFFRDNSVDAILCLRGGYGSARILDFLDYKAIRQNPKLLLGYSDITALHTAIGQRSGLVTIHGPMLSSLQNELTTEYTLEQFFAGIASAEPVGEFKPAAGQRISSLVEGTASGVLVGGNLTVIASMAGTPYELEGKGCLLFIEDIGEEAYRVDRMLNQLWQNGLLNRVNGIIVGDFSDCKDGEFTVQEVIQHYASLAGKPTIYGITAGHELDNGFLPLGVKGTIYAAGEASRLVIEEAHAFK